jgi:hypothetical protein
MITRNTLPENYKPYDTLVVCSNKLSGGAHIVAVGDVFPLIIGKGKKPKIWLQAMSAPDSKEFITIVEESISKHPAVKVQEDGDSIIITIQDSKVLVVSSSSNDSATVSELDLKSVGLNISGNQKSLSVGGSTFSGNSMSGGGALIGFGV